MSINRLNLSGSSKNPPSLNGFKNGFNGGRLRTVIADSASCTVLDLQACAKQDVELVAPVQENTFTASKVKRRAQRQIPREEFRWDESQQCYHCPQGHRLSYRDRRKWRSGNRQLWEYRFRCDAAHCRKCPRAEDCLRPGAACRTIKRLEGAGLLDRQRAKMCQPEAQRRYRLRCLTVELASADSKGNRRRRCFHGRGLHRARAETGLMVVA